MRPTTVSITFLFTFWHCYTSSETLSSCGHSAGWLPINTWRPNVPHLRGLKAKQTPGFHFQAALKKSMWEFESNISDVLFVYVLLPFVFLWGSLGTVIMSRRAMPLMAQARWGLPPNVRVKLTPCGGCMQKNPNQFWSWYVGKINETSNKVKLSRSDEKRRQVGALCVTYTMFHLWNMPDPRSLFSVNSWICLLSNLVNN